MAPDKFELSMQLLLDRGVPGISPTGTQHHRSGVRIHMYMHKTNDFLIAIIVESLKLKSLCAVPNVRFPRFCGKQFIVVISISWLVV